MAKCNLIASIKGDENIDIKTVGIISKNKIIYKENNISVIIIKLKNKLEIIRECSDYKIRLIFDSKKRTNSVYNLFGANKDFFLETITKKLIINSNNIVVEYELEGNKFLYLLQIGDMLW